MVPIEIGPYVTKYHFFIALSSKDHYFQHLISFCLLSHVPVHVFSLIKPPRKPAKIICGINIWIIIT